jgi:hypothetical protein
MFALLKEMYDFIIIDTPPIGLVTDAFLLMKYTDANLILVRQNFTHKKVFSSIISDMEQRKLPNLAILINDVKAGKVFIWIWLRIWVWIMVMGMDMGKGTDLVIIQTTGRRRKNLVLKRIFGRS